VVKLLFTRGEDKLGTAVDTLQNPILKVWHGTILREKGEALPFASPVGLCYSISRRLFFRFRLRARACFTRNFSPGFK
jgi:hypothetical protein